LRGNEELRLVIVLVLVVVLVLDFGHEATNGCTTLDKDSGRHGETRGRTVEDEYENDLQA